MIKIDLTHAKLASSIFEKQKDVSRIHTWIHEKTYKGSDYLGWVDWPVNYDRDEFERVIKAAKTIKENADVLLVCGVGGSYLGARAAIEFVKGLYDESSPKIYYVGNTFSSTALLQILKNIEGKSVYVNVISKSGTTTETALAFRMIRLKMQEWYGDDAKKRIFATTDKARGTLKQLSEQMGYETFTIPDDVGGRYSVFTSVGLLPIAAAGVDIRALMQGSLDAYNALNTDDLALNPAYQYAVARKLLEASGKSVEIMVSYESHFGMLAEWWKQLFGESEGKEGKGLFPASVINSTDLHSMGQFIQEGKKVFFESVLRVNEVLLDGVVLSSENDTDQINYLGGKSLHWVNQQALLGTLSAHVNEGNVPNIIIDIPKHDAYTFGYLIYFYFKAVAMSVYMDDVNPFDQPGVEVYKRNMFKLLGK
jgi:glucose-6-phosphate isomerase